MKKQNRRCDPQKQAYWEDVLRRWRTSGQTVREFCRNAGVPEIGTAISGDGNWHDDARRQKPCVSHRPRPRR